MAIILDAARRGQSLHRVYAHVSKQICSVAAATGGGKWSMGKLCDRTKALGGCRKEDGSIFWVLPSPKQTTLEDARAACTVGTFVLPNEAP